LSGGFYTGDKVEKRGLVKFFSTAQGAKNEGSLSIQARLRKSRSGFSHGNKGALHEKGGKKLR
jgi:hypothetical protein